MSKHSIIIIKNDKNEYLQYFDEEWNCYLFLNSKMNNKDDIKSIYNKFDTLGLKKQDVILSYKGELKHKKYSVSAKKEKEYHHYFYEVKLLNNITMSEEYKWFSMEELQKNDRIQKINGDIVEYICYNINT